MTKSRKKWIICVLIVTILWGVFAVTRYSDFTTYVPFSGRVFSIDSERTDRIFIQNGTTGEQVFFETAGEKEQIAERLNNLRYSIWIPTIPVAKGGWSYRVAIEVDGRQYSCSFSGKSMTVNGIVYVFPGEQLAEFREYVE